MLFGSNALGGALRRWRDYLRSRARRFDDEFETAPRDRQYELWACAMAPEYVTLAAIMALGDRGTTDTNGDRLADED